MMKNPHVLLFDLYAGGHHGQYVRQLVEYWGAHELHGRLTVLARPAFFERHGDVLRVAAHCGATCKPIAEPVEMRGFIRGALAHGRYLRKYIKSLRPTHAVCMYFDQVQLSLALGLRFGYPVALSGIYFRPTFHYDEATAAALKDRITRMRKRRLLTAALRNPHFKTLFCLDPYVVPYVPPTHAQLVPLPDGAPVCPPLKTPEILRAQWGIDPNRSVALFFGSIAARKGIFQTLDALPLLPVAGQRQLSLVIIGRDAPHEQQRVKDHVARSLKATEVQIIHEARFVNEEEIPGLFGCADLVLLPYQRHVGSSGVLVRAAQASVPVLGSDYGLVGRHIHTHQLGLAVDSARPSAIAAGLAQWLSGGTFPFDPVRALAFGSANTAEHFGQTVFGTLFPDTPSGVTTQSHP